MTGTIKTIEKAKTLQELNEIESFLVEHTGRLNTKTKYLDLINKKREAFYNEV